MYTVRVRKSKAHTTLSSHGPVNAQRTLYVVRKMNAHTQDIHDEHTSLIGVGGARVVARESGEAGVW